jgi:hypothetical protein
VSDYALALRTSFFWVIGGRPTCAALWRLFEDRLLAMA